MLRVQSLSNLTIKIPTQQHMLNLPQQILSIIDSTHLNVKIITDDNIVQPHSTVFHVAGAKNDLELVRTVLLTTFGQHIDCSMTPAAVNAITNWTSDLFSSIFKVEEIARVSVYYAPVAASNYSITSV